MEYEYREQLLYAVIPCCGFGTRVGMRSDQSKELLINPETGKPLIQWHIDLCEQYKIRPIFLVRPEKQDLVTYLTNLGLENNIVLYSPIPGEEWMSTIYNNKEHYGPKNILLLPDTVFQYEACMADFLQNLAWLEVVILTHEVPENERHLWGIYSPQQQILFEKNKNADSNKAWGVIGFDLSMVGMFSDLEKYKEFNLQKLVKHDIPIKGFKDLTRK